MLRHQSDRQVSQGRPTPLGPTLTADGCKFALHSRHATVVFLVLFDPTGARVTDVVQLDHDLASARSAVLMLAK